ncbi:hypothetical protein TeGR_g12950, partial [Tetraparma gracilis]
MKLYKNGVLISTNTNGHEPFTMTRTNHWVGRSQWAGEDNFDGTIGYLRTWHGVELDQDD